MFLITKVFMLKRKINNSFIHSFNYQVSDSPIFKKPWKNVSWLAPDHEQSRIQLSQISIQILQALKQKPEKTSNESIAGNGEGFWSQLNLLWTFFLFLSNALKQKPEKNWRRVYRGRWIYQRSLKPHAVLYLCCVFFQKALVEVAENSF